MTQHKPRRVMRQVASRMLNEKSKGTQRLDAGRISPVAFPISSRGNGKSASRGSIAVATAFAGGIDWKHIARRPGSRHAYPLLWKVESPTLWKGDITIVEDGETIKAKADLVKRSPAEFVYEAELDNGDTARVVFRKVKTERKRKAKE